MSEIVLIAGGTGLIGQELSPLLKQHQYKVRILTTRKEKCDGENYFHWNPDASFIDPKAIDGVSHIINLAGEPIMGKWTEAKKKRIVESRTNSATLIAQFLEKESHQVKTLCSASAVGIYGDGNDRILTETTETGNDFLADTCKAWEKAQLCRANIRQVCLRVGVVLSPNGGALAKMLPTFRLGLGMAIGTGKQYMPWIHIEDMCRMFLFAIQNENLTGTFNACSPAPVTNTHFSSVLNQRVKKVFFSLKVPAFVLKLTMGETAVLALYSQRTSSQKICDAGFAFYYPKINDALKQLVPI